MLKLPLVLAVAAGTLLSVARADFSPAHFDPAVKPQDDFYRYANGTWLKSTPIPPEFSRWGAADILIQRNLESLRVLCERATAENTAASSIERMVGNFYASGLDEGTIEAAGVTPLKFELERIEALKTPAAVLAEIGHLHTLGVDVGFEFGSGADNKDSTREIAQLLQGGLGLPDRDYYFRDDARSKELRDQYLAHVVRMLRLLGDNPGAAQAGAAAVMRLETALAQDSLTPVALRDPYASYHKMTLDAAETTAPGIDWKAYFTAVGAPPFTELNFAHPKFFQTFAGILTQTPVAEWRTYLRWHLAHTYAPYLSSDFVRENFAFYGTTLTGVKVMKPRWKRVVATIDGSIGEALGQLYTASYFPPEAKARVLQLVDDLRAALGERLRTLEWMDDATKAKAQAKLAAFTVKIGYPDKWRDYSSLVIDRGPYVLNVLKANAFEVRRDLRKIGGPVDRTEWEMSPPTVNAYYSPERNEIVFPAGILQPPFFDPQADDAVNYGAVGSVIGHEMTHGYDDEGNKFDAQGNLNEWWTPESAARFKERAAAIVRQFNAYFVFPDLHINGELTQGENIADLGGLKLAFAALQRALGAGSRAPIGGFTPEQRFFLSFASIWASNYRPEALRLQVNSNPHSPGEFRVNGPLSNLEEFATAFAVPAGAPMRRAPADRVVIW